MAYIEPNHSAPPTGQPRSDKSRPVDDTGYLSEEHNWL